ncbi:probable ATP-dependent RNA helicase DDX28 [Mercenaria mercenaria]|uniref:probable ATP-dependent RNA helicase DDX28 n=1 Tax=Mercenaria mercenaria TaxID=6596 RepID=UPI00234E6318|nr:probable ATP-dependent RNA helicase DDX28 [Mercenaria mercenaria]
MLTWCRLRVLLQYRAPLQTRFYATDTDVYPRITVPQRMLQKLAKHNVRKAKEEAMKKRLRLKTLVISSKRKEYQFYKGQKFDVFDPKQLASHGWKHRNCSYDHFTLVCHKANPAVPSEDGAEVNFEQFDLDERILQFLHSEGIEKPTNIQSMVIPQLLAGKHIVCAAETGSGKTYAYLLPIVHNIIRQKKAGLLSDKTKNSPHSVIVVPSIELASQIMGVCENIAQTVPIKPFLVDRRRKTQAVLREDGGQVMDVLISTPGVLTRLLNTNYIQVSKMTCLVLDEADTLLDDSFCSLTRRILRKLQVGKSSAIGETYMNEGVQVSLVSATFPKGLEESVGDVLPIDSFEQLTTRHLHQLMPHVPQKFIKMKSADKFATLLSILKKKTNMMSMIFCNKQNACMWLSKSLEEMGIDNVCVVGYLDEEKRYSQLKSFLEGETNVLVCTDIASRGIDTKMVDHVINFDFPNHVSDYIHRVGRVGRVGAKNTGQVTNFIVNPWDVDLVWKIEISARRQMELTNVDANIKRKVNRIQPTKKGLELQETKIDDSPV